MEGSAGLKSMRVHSAGNMRRTEIRYYLALVAVVTGAGAAGTTGAGVAGAGVATGTGVGVGVATGVGVGVGVATGVGAGVGVAGSAVGVATAGAGAAVSSGALEQAQTPTRQIATKSFFIMEFWSFSLKLRSLTGKRQV